MSNGLWIAPADLGSDYEDLEFAQEACEAASFILWALSGRKFSGFYSITERYCLEERPLAERYYLVPGVGYALPKNIYVVRYQDLEQKVVRLRGRPVLTVESVFGVRSGEEIDAENFDLWEHSFIKFNSDLNQDIDVTYSYGKMPPAAGVMAARHLAIQFALLWSGHEDECSLPERVTSVTRQDVSWTILDNQNFIDELKTGIYAIDLFLRAVNPDKARAKAKVFSPDIPRGRRKYVAPTPPTP